MAWRNGESSGLQQELEHARFLTTQTPGAGALEMPGTHEMATLEMERLEALSGAVESLRDGRHKHGAVRLLEHLAKASPREFSLRDAGIVHQHFEVSQ